MIWTIPPCIKAICTSTLPKTLYPMSKLSLILFSQIEFLITGPGPGGNGISLTQGGRGGNEGDRDFGSGGIKDGCDGAVRSLCASVIIGCVSFETFACRFPWSPSFVRLLNK